MTGASQDCDRPQHERPMWLQACRRQLQEYSQLLRAPPSHQHEHDHGSAAVCDRCLQPIDEATFQANLARLRTEADNAAALQRLAADRARATQVCPGCL